MRIRINYQPRCVSSANSADCARPLSQQTGNVSGRGGRRSSSNYALLRLSCLAPVRSRSVSPENVVWLCKPSSLPPQRKAFSIQDRAALICLDIFGRSIRERFAQVLLIKTNRDVEGWKWVAGNMPMCKVFCKGPCVV